MTARRILRAALGGAAAVLALAFSGPGCYAEPSSLLPPPHPARDEFIVGLEVGNEAFMDREVADWRLDQVAALGAGWVRVNVPWVLVEQEPGILTWDGSASKSGQAP